VWTERADIKDLFDHGALFYTCGSGAKLGSGVKSTLVDIIAEKSGKTKEEAQKTYEKLAKDRYRTDVFL
jgi:cytochrome P450/NADPH-cytochrome P450 reductase